MHALISVNGKEICAYRKACTYKRAVYGTTHFFRLTRTRLQCTAAATDSPWLFISFEDTVSGEKKLEIEDSRNTGGLGE